MTATATAPPRIPPRPRVATAGDPDDLAARLVCFHRQRRQLAALERRAAILAGELERAAERLRRGFPVHPPLEPNLPPEGITRFAARVRDLREWVRREEEELNQRLEV